MAVSRVAIARFCAFPSPQKFCTAVLLLKIITTEPPAAVPTPNARHFQTLTNAKAMSELS
jgi:hypothetical protein